jgi:ProP effector
VTEEERQRHKATIHALAERWPKCFAVDEKQRRPLKIGIGKEVAGVLTDIDVSAAVAFYTRSARYMKACVAGAVRIGLDGEPAGTVTAEEEGFARRRLARRGTKQEKTKPQREQGRPILSLPRSKSKS